MANGKTSGPRRQLRSAIVRGHRWVGLGSFVVLLVIAGTGVLLNHTAGLNLDGRMVEKNWVMRWYGMEPEGEPVAFAADERLVTDWGGRLVYGDYVLDAEGALAGAAVIGGEVAVVCRDAIYLVDREGTLLEKVALLPEGAIERAGVSVDGALAIRAGDSVYKRVGGVFEEVEDESGITWSEEIVLSEAVHEQLARLHRGKGLPLYRVILDLHSGKFFGTAGVVLYDLAAVAVVLLSATGVWLAVRNFYRSGRGGRTQ